MVCFFLVCLAGCHHESQSGFLRCGVPAPFRHCWKWAGRRRGWRKWWWAGAGVTFGGPQPSERSCCQWAAGALLAARADPQPPSWPKPQPSSTQRKEEWWVVQCTHVSCSMCSPQKCCGGVMVRVLMTLLLLIASYNVFFVRRTNNLELIKLIYIVRWEGLSLLAVEVPESSSDKCFRLLF